MKIMHIIPGSGGSFYCGNCLRDSKFVEALRASEHEVVKLPMYLPLFANEHDLSKEIPVFYGAISIYMKQQFPIFRKAPGWVDKMFNSKPMLRLASKFAGSTRAKGLEEMTISMLLGEEGEQKQELDKMVDWIAEHCDPDVIHLSNALLLGLAHQLKEKVGVPVFCSLQDEDVWVDVMNPEAADMVWELCGLGRTAPNPIKTTLRFFRDEYEAHINGVCPTGKCKEMIQYSITDDCIGCTLCAQDCPVGAIEFRPHEKHEIDVEKCIKCDGCVQVCPEDAVVRIATGTGG